MKIIYIGIVIIIAILTYGLTFNQITFNNDSLKTFSGSEVSRLETGRFLISPYYRIFHANTITPVITNMIMIIFYILAAQLINYLKLKMLLIKL